MRDLVTARFLPVVSHKRNPPPPPFIADVPRQSHTSQKACKGEGFGESGLFLTLHPPSLGLSLDLKLARAVFLLEPWFLFSNKKKSTRGKSPFKIGDMYRKLGRTFDCACVKEICSRHLSRVFQMRY